jgi:hypothetical protein
MTLFSTHPGLFNTVVAAMIFVGIASVWSANRTERRTKQYEWRSDSRLLIIATLLAGILVTLLGNT